MSTTSSEGDYSFLLVSFLTIWNRAFFFATPPLSIVTTYLLYKNRGPLSYDRWVNIVRTVAWEGMYSTLIAGIGANIDFSSTPFATIRLDGYVASLITNRTLLAAIGAVAHSSCLVLIGISGIRLIVEIDEHSPSRAFSSPLALFALNSAIGLGSWGSIYTIFEAMFNARIFDDSKPILSLTVVGLSELLMLVCIVVWIAAHASASLTLRRAYKNMANVTVSRARSTKYSSIFAFYTVVYLGFFVVPCFLIFTLYLLSRDHFPAVPGALFMALMSAHGLVIAIAYPIMLPFIRPSLLTRSITKEMRRCCVFGSPGSDTTTAAVYHT